MLIGLACILILGIGAQWLAWRLRLPSILLLLLVGILAGPVAKHFLHDQHLYLDPDALFGDLLLPIVSLFVALILYEGGLTLKFSELPAVGPAVRNLVTIGVLLTWGIAFLAGRYILGLDWRLAALLGAILTVTGPTVIQPLLQHIRPTGAVGPTLKWEGIVIDPIGALLAVLVFEAIYAASIDSVLPALVKTVLIGGGLGMAGAVILILLLKEFWIPDHLQNAVSLALAVAVFTGANAVQHESGLFAVTLMGMLLANQKFADIEHIIEFKENLRVLLISILFVLLAARLEMEQLRSIGPATALFVAVLILIARPLSVIASTWRSDFSNRQRAFLAWMAPRGIVAAAVASIFAIRLQEDFPDQAEILVSVTFAVIIGTVLVYGLSAKWLAVRLKLAQRDPQGLLIIGADPWSMALAQTLQDLGFTVLLVDTNRQQTAAARMAGLHSYTGSPLDEHFLDRADLGGIGRLFAVTPNDWVNAMSSKRMARLLGTANVYQLPAAKRVGGTKVSHEHLGGRPLFGDQVNYRELQRRIDSGQVIKVNKLSDEFDYLAFVERYGQAALPLMIITEAGRIEPIIAGSPVEPEVGQTLVSLVNPDAEAPEPLQSDAAEDKTSSRDGKPD